MSFLDGLLAKGTALWKRGTGAVIQPTRVEVDPALSSVADNIVALKIGAVVPASQVWRQQSDGSAPAGAYMPRTLLEFSADPTGVALCDDAFSNYIAYLIAANAPICLIPTGRYRISHSLAFTSAALVGLKIKGEYAFSNGTAFGTGTIIIWAGATATDDVIILGQPYQQIKNIHVEVAANCRNIVTWQRSVSSPGNMTAPVFENITATLASSGYTYVGGIAITPDAPHSAETGHDNGIIHHCVFSGFSGYGIKNFNTTGQAYKWTISCCDLIGTWPTNDCTGIDWSKGVFDGHGNGFGTVRIETTLPIAAYSSHNHGYSEGCRWFYSIGGSGNATTAEINKHSFSWQGPDGGDTSYPHRTSIVSDFSPGPRTIDHLYVQPVGGSGSIRNFCYESGNVLNSGCVNTVGASYLPTCNPFATSRTPFSRVSMNRIKPDRGTVGAIPRGYGAGDLDVAHEYRVVEVQDVQVVKNPWIVDPHGQNIGAFLVGGPRMLTDLDTDGCQLQEWLSDDGQAGAVASTVATGRTGWLGTTQTGHGQALVGSEGLDGTSPRAAMQLVNRASLNPGAASFLVAAVIRPKVAALGSSTYQCAIGKGASTDDPSATHFSCLISPTGYPILRWGRSSSEQFAISTHKILLNQTDQFVVWGVDRENGQVVYMVGSGNTADAFTNAPERIAISGSPALVFSNTSNMQIGCDAAGANPFDGGVTMIVIRSGPFSDRLLQYHARQVCREMGLLTFQ